MDHQAKLAKMAQNGPFEKLFTQKWITMCQWITTWEWIPTHGRVKSGSVTYCNGTFLPAFLCHRICDTILCFIQHGVTNCYFTQNSVTYAMAQKSWQKRAVTICNAFPFTHVNTRPWMWVDHNLRRQVTMHDLGSSCSVSYDISAMHWFFFELHVLLGLAA